MKGVLVAFLLLSSLGGCASDVPLVILEPPADNPTLANVQTNPKAFVNRRVRWGGVILSTKRVGNMSEVEILAKAIDIDGRPAPGDVTPGRFLASNDHFLNPATFSAGREVTVFGVLDNVLTRNIGEYPYRYPLVKAVHLYLWAGQRYYRHGTRYPRFHFGLGVGVGF